MIENRIFKPINLPIASVRDSEVTHRKILSTPQGVLTVALMLATSAGVFIVLTSSASTTVAGIFLFVSLNQ